MACSHIFYIDFSCFLVLFSVLVASGVNTPEVSLLLIDLMLLSFMQKVKMLIKSTEKRLNLTVDPLIWY